MASTFDGSFFFLDTVTVKKEGSPKKLAKRSSSLDKNHHVKFRNDVHKLRKNKN